jgi:hypothetical protein
MRSPLELALEGLSLEPRRDAVPLVRCEGVCWRYPPLLPCEPHEQVAGDVVLHGGIAEHRAQRAVDDAANRLLAEWLAATFADEVAQPRLEQPKVHRSQGGKLLVGNGVGEHVTGHVAPIVAVQGRAHFPTPLRNPFRVEAAHRVAVAGYTAGRQRRRGVVVRQCRTRINPLCQEVTLELPHPVPPLPRFRGVEPARVPSDAASLGVAPDETQLSSVGIERAP